jgi:hypothetical protein
MGLGEYFPRFGSRANVHQRHLFVLAGGAQCSCHIRDPSKAAKTHHGPSSSDIPVGSIVTRGTSARNPPSQVAIHHVLRNRPLSISGPLSWRPRISGLPLLNKGKGSICELLSLCFWLVVLELGEEKRPGLGCDSTAGDEQCGPLIGAGHFTRPAGSRDTAKTLLMRSHWRVR